MKRWLALILTLVLCVSLFGCKKKAASDDDDDLLPQPAEQMTYDFDDLQFSLYFPDNWYNFFAVTRDETKPVVTVAVDGEDVFALAAFDQDSTLPQTEDALEMEGYRYFTENAQKVFYLRIYRELPESLQYELTDEVSAANAGMTTTEYAIVKLFEYHDADTLCPATRSEWLESWLYPQRQDYVNYRLGFTLHFPEEWLGQFILVPSEDRVRVYVRDLLESRMYRESAYIFDIITLPAGSVPDAEAENAEVVELGYSDSFTYYALVYERDLLAGAAYEFYYVELAEQLRSTMFEMLRT